MEQKKKNNKIKNFFSTLGKKCFSILKKIGLFFAFIGKKIWSFIKVEGKKPSNYLQLGLIAILILFLIAPLILLLTGTKSADINYVFNHPSFGESILNSVIYSLVGSIISVVLAVIAAYFLSHINIKGKHWIVLLLSLPMLIPTLSIGLGTKFLFSSRGFLYILFGNDFEGLGFFNLIFGSVVFSFPIAFLLIYDALLYEDRSIYDASEIFGASRFRSFFLITIPYLKSAIISAFFASFTLIFSDYGLPMEVAGKVKTLPMFLYEEVLSTSLYGRGAVISLVLLAPAILAFVIDIIAKDSGEGTARKESIKPSKLFNVLGISIPIIIGIILFLPQIVFISVSFMKRFPNDLSFTLANYENSFSSSSSLSIVKYVTNSLIIAFLAGLIGTIVAYITGYLSARSKGKMAKPLHLFSIATLAVPGLVLGIGYIFLFKSTKGWFYGTIAILVVVNIIHYFSSPYLMAKNAFNKINKDYETVAETLGISKVSLFFRVMVPNTISTIIQMFSYLFINSMITISAVSFLASVKTRPLAVAITSYEPLQNWTMESVI